jgi:hypothetical protein
MWVSWFAAANSATSILVIRSSATHATATQRHLVVSVFHRNPMSSRVVPAVVDGRATVELSNEDPNESATEAVPVTEILSMSPSLGAPVRLW